MGIKRGTYKLVFLGNTSVGKSCIINRFINNKFFEFQEPTIGAAFSTASVKTDDLNIRFEIWDTAGQERYKSLAPMYYRGARAAVVVYDITSKDSFNGAKAWVNEIKKNGRDDCVIAFVGNKIDVDKREVEQKEVLDYVKTGEILHIETSAKTGENIQYLFNEISIQLPHNAGTSPISRSEPITMYKNNRYTTKSCC